MKKRHKIVSFLLSIVLFISLFTVSFLDVGALTNSEIHNKLANILYGGSGGSVSCAFDGYTTTSGRHEGIDFVKYRGAPVYSLISGTVIRVNNTSSSSSLSTLAIYDEQNNKSVIYLHTANICVSTGSSVRQGQLVAYESDRGISGVPHTHVEVRNGRQQYAAKSVNDPVLDNPNPYSYWETVLGSPVPPVSFTQDGNYPTPITAYPAATSGKITVYNSSLTAYSQSTRYIAYNDLCTINAVYTNGYCNVTYPTSSGTHTEYAKTSDFIPNGVTPYSWSPSENLTTFARSDMSTSFGSVFTTDSCKVVGKTSDTKLQIIYPISGGYKLGWVNVPVVIPSDFPTPLKGYNASASARTAVHESLSTMGDSYGQIFVDDECTLNAVNVSGGWAYVTYPITSGTKKGYVYLSEFIPSDSKLTTFYTTTVTQQSTTYRKPDMATNYGWVSVGDEITVIGKSGSKLQILYPIDAQYGGGYKIAWMYDTYVVKNITGISVTANPSKTSYLEGDELDKSGLVITAKYDDGSSANVTNSCSFSGYDSTPGVKTVTATYSGKQTAFTVTVNSKSPTAITIKTMPNKTVYQVGEEIDLTGLEVQASFDNGTTELIDNYAVLYDKDVTDTQGKKALIIKYTYNDVEIVKEFNITVGEYEHIAGDVNGDSHINMKDIVLLQQYLNEWKVEIDELAADVTGDNTVNMKDIVLLQQYMNGWKVELK